MRTTVSTLVLATALSVAAATSTIEAQVPTMSNPTKSGRVQANGVDYYYEIHGSGEPLLLLHGGLGSMDMFRSSLLPALGKTRQVIAVDLQGHGRTTLGNRPIDLVDIGNDLAVVLDTLGYKQVDVAGYSFGGGAALRLAIQHPAVVRRLAIISAPYAQSGFFPEMLPQQAAVGSAMAEQMKETPMYKSYVGVAPNPNDFPRLLDRMGEYMRRPYDWSEDVKKLSIPVMLVFGDADMVRPEHIVQFYQLLGGGLKDAGWQREHMSRARLAIIPDVTHYEMFLSPALAPTILPFLDGKGGSKTWAEQVRDQ
jgi:pimeloyl-ACP methyl ester carboxylesterase